MTKPLFIFDIDGTLAHNKHRAHLAPAKEDMHIDSNWTPWGEACSDDTTYEDIVKTLRVLIKGGADIWFWSARSARFEVQTADWLFDHVLPPQRHPVFRIDVPKSLRISWLRRRFGFRMRPVGLSAGDHHIKQEWLHSLTPTDRNRLVGIFEDRNSVVAMWREEDVTCFHVAEADW